MAPLRPLCPEQRGLAHRGSPRTRTFCS